MNILLVLLPLLMLLNGCGEQSTTPTAASGTVSISMHHIFADKDFALGTSYSLANGEAMKGSLLRYYVSNIALQKIDGTMYTVPQDASYVLVDMSNPASLSFSFSGIPAGTYKVLYFVIGVDSLRSTMGLDKRTGVLDVGAASQDMYWSWNQGYIHFKLEGSYTSPNGSGDVRYHIGGFGGYSTKTINCVRSVKVDLSGKPCIIASNQLTALHIGADVQKIFTGKQAISVAINNSVMFAPFATTVADNYATMFSHIVKD